MPTVKTSPGSGTPPTARLTTWLMGLAWPVQLRVAMSVHPQGWVGHEDARRRELVGPADRELAVALAAAARARALHVRAGRQVVGPLGGRRQRVLQEADGLAL